MASVGGPQTSERISNRLDEELGGVAVIVPRELQKVPAEIHDAIRPAAIVNERQVVVMVGPTIQLDRQSRRRKGKVDSRHEAISVVDLELPDWTADTCVDQELPHHSVERAVRRPGFAIALVEESSQLSASVPPSPTVPHQRVHEVVPANQPLAQRRIDSAIQPGATGHRCEVEHRASGTGYRHSPPTPGIGQVELG